MAACAPCAYWPLRRRASKLLLNWNGIQGKCQNTALTKKSLAHKGYYNMTAQSFAALVRRSTSAFESSDLALWTSSKGYKSSRFHKYTVCINNTSSKDLIRKLQFIKRAPISFFNYEFFPMPGQQGKDWDAYQNQAPCAAQ